MKFISAQLEILQNNKELEEFHDDIDYIENFLEENQIIIPEEFHLTFSNHVIVLLQRIKNNECVIYEDSENNEITQESLENAKKLLKPLFEKYQINESKTEEMLLAIYFGIGGSNL